MFCAAVAEHNGVDMSTMSDDSNEPCAPRVKSRRRSRRVAVVIVLVLLVPTTFAYRWLTGCPHSERACGGVQIARVVDALPDGLDRVSGNFVTDQLADVPIGHPKRPTTYHSYEPLDRVQRNLAQRFARFNEHGNRVYEQPGNFSISLVNLPRCGVELSVTLEAVGNGTNISIYGGCYD